MIDFGKISVRLYIINIIILIISSIKVFNGQINLFLYFISTTLLTLLLIMSIWQFLKKKSWQFLVFMIIPLILVWITASNLNAEPNEITQTNLPNPTIISECPELAEIEQSSDVINSKTEFMNISPASCSVLLKHRIRVSRLEYLIETTNLSSFCWVMCEELTPSRKETNFTTRIIAYLDFRGMEEKIIKGFLPSYKKAEDNKIDNFRIEISEVDQISNQNFFSKVQENESMFSRFSIPLKPTTKFKLSNRKFYLSESDAVNNINPQYLMADLCWNGCPEITVIVKNLPQNALIEASYAEVKRFKSNRTEKIIWQIPASEKLRINEVSFLYLKGFYLAVENVLKSRFIPGEWSLDDFKQLNLQSLLITLVLLSILTFIFPELKKFISSS